MSQPVQPMSAHGAGAPRRPSGPSTATAGAGVTLGLVLATAAFAAFGAAMLGLLGAQTEAAPGGKGWWTEPALAPGIALAILAIFGVAALARQLARAVRQRAVLAEPVPLAALWRHASVLAEYGFYFTAYVWSVPRIGFAISTFCFVQIASWRAGLRGWRTTLYALLLTAAMVSLFRVALAVWIPSADLYEALPDAIRNFAIRFL